MDNREPTNIIQQQVSDQPTEIYYKTHRSYMMVAGLLVCWLLGN